MQYCGIVLYAMFLNNLKEILRETQSKSHEAMKVRNGNFPHKKLAQCTVVSGNRATNPPKYTQTTEPFFPFVNSTIWVLFYDFHTPPSDNLTGQVVQYDYRRNSGHRE